MKQHLKYLLGFVFIMGIIIYLLLTSFRSSLQYYVTVSELMQAQSEYRDRTLKVAGRAHGVVRREIGDESFYQFTVAEGGERIGVNFSGFVPDTFREGSEVVVTGHLRGDGTFQADDILAKCASKYEAKLNP